MIIFFKDRSLDFVLGQHPWGHLESTPYMPETKSPSVLGKPAHMTRSQKRDYTVTY